jgi:hypothetical protein
MNAFVGSYDLATDEVHFRIEPVVNGQIIGTDGEFVSLSKLSIDPWASEIAVADGDPDFEDGFIVEDEPTLREHLTGILQRRFESTRQVSARAVASYKKQGLKTAADFLNRPTKVITLRDLQRVVEEDGVRKTIDRVQWDSSEAKDTHISFFKEHRVAPEFNQDGNVIELKRKLETADWRSQFVTIGQLETGGVKMLIEGFLPEGVSMLGALPGVGKTWFALSLAKALTTGEKFLGRFEVTAPVPVLYLIPESSGGAFRARAEKFRIPNDPNLFLCRTVSQGSTLLISDPAVLAAVKELKPVIILDTAIRFNRGNDENSSNSNKLFVDDSLNLIAAGARAVFGLHHSTKASRKEALTQENALRGTGDLAAMCDSVYGLRRNDGLFDNGNGPLEIEVTCLKPREFKPPLPFTIAASTKTKEGIVSCIDADGDFKIIASCDVTADLQTRFVAAITELPQASMEDVAEVIGASKVQVQRVANQLGYKKARNQRWELFRLKSQEPEKTTKAIEVAV